jgi:hypothetical protein
MMGSLLNRRSLLDRLGQLAGDALALGLGDVLCILRGRSGRFGLSPRLLHLRPEPIGRQPLLIRARLRPIGARSLLINLSRSAPSLMASFVCPALCRKSVGVCLIRTLAGLVGPHFGSISPGARICELST